MHHLSKFNQWLVLPFFAVIALITQANRPSPLNTSSIQCPEDSELHDEVQEGLRIQWCERSDTTLPMKHGPFAIFYDDAESVKYRGVFVDGRRHGEFHHLSRSGGLLETRFFWRGIFGQQTENSEGLCSDGAVEILAVEGKLPMLSCYKLDQSGNPYKHGQSLTFGLTPNGERGRAIESQEFRNNVKDGIHRRWHGNGELAVEEEYRENALNGPSRSWYETGAQRDSGENLDGNRSGKRHFYTPKGDLQWVAVYEPGRVMSVKGKNEVLETPCPEGSVAILDPDQSGAWCERVWGIRTTRDGPYVEWSDDGTIRESGLYRRGQKVEVWEGAGSEVDRRGKTRPPLVAQGTIRHNLRLLSDLTSTEPQFLFSDKTADARVNPQVEIDGSSFKIYGLAEGPYRVTVLVDAESSNPQRYPGDFEGGSNFEVRHESVSELTVNLDRLIRLTLPNDNQKPISGWIAGNCMDVPVHAPKIQFAWEPMYSDADYHYEVILYQCSPHRRLHAVVQELTVDPEVRLELPPNRPGELYAFSVKAERNRRSVGHLIVHAEAGMGWAYRFRVDETQ